MGFMDILGAIATPVSNIASSIIGAKSNNRNIDKQIAAQGQENQKTREYNLMLAQMQNAWNQEQWERENEYNSPVNQMKRFKEAGLNPDLMYQNGNPGNAAQLSGGLTSGAPATPQDFSALGQKKTIGDVVAQSLNNEMMRAQIDKIRAEADKTKKDGELTQFDLDTKNAIKLITGSDAEEMVNQLDKKDPFVRRAIVELANLEKDYGIKANEFRSSSYDATIKEENSKLASEFAQKKLKLLSEQLKITEQEAKDIVQSASARLRGIELDKDLKQIEVDWSNPKNLSFTISSLVPLLRLIFGK